MKKIYLAIIALSVITSVFLIKKHNINEPKDVEIQNKLDKPEMFTKYMKDITTRIGSTESEYKMNYQITELNKAVQKLKSSFAKNTEIDWVLRGPANIGGRTRCIVVDPDDVSLNTWFASAASGGVWKTTDGGANWTNLSGLFSNLSINALKMAASDYNVLYAGTGESFPGGTYLKGNGIWKSIDRGQTWEQLESTATNDDFSYINRLAISPIDANIVIAATESGIFKTTDGGVNWINVYTSNYGVEDLVPDPTDFNILLAGEHNLGVIRSDDMGETWTKSSDGLERGTRFEVAISPVDQNYAYVSVNVSGSQSEVYMSIDNGITWKLFNDNQNFLGGQGDYDNTIAAHPYNVDEVFVGGVDVWKVKFDGTEEVSQPKIKNVYTENLDFVSFVNFGGDFLDGGLSTEDGFSLENGDTVAIEIRFGINIKQKAHRFNVPLNATSGVPAASYTYQDYIDVPFEVWDMTNNRQLMVSFRDQEIDGEFNLYERLGEDYGELGREYIFINSVEYNASAPDENIINDGGHLYKSLFMLWPILTTDATWDANNLPESKIIVDYGTTNLFNGTKTIIADSYSQYGGSNDYDQSAGFGSTSIPGLHPDHHNITIIPTGDGNFKWIDGNDGGLGVSDDNGVTFTQIPTNYITTQFYGVAKNPEANEYIGGMQDNGTWQSAAGENASDTSKYLFRIGGDGFECLWHAEDPLLLLGSIYYNSFKRSTSGGAYWGSVTGITYDDGPFVTKLSASTENPDMVFAVGGLGIYKSINFGSTWSKKAISTNWTLDETVRSAHNVEVSIANGNIVWAGAGMAKELGYQMQVSTNEGSTFIAVEDYDIVDMSAYTSGIATHPTEDSTAFVLFSLKGAPKVLRTINLGASWEDISGFGTGNVSTNGFPDVVIHTLLVMPHNPNIIWVGTDIGLFESTDNGVSWHFADNGLVPVSVYDMQVSGQQVIVATHGRGIWTVDIPEINNVPRIKKFSYFEVYEVNINTYFKVEYDSVQIYIDNSLATTLQTPEIGDTTIDANVTEDGLHVSYMFGYVNGTAYKSNTIDLNFTYTPSTIGTNNIANKSILLYPNPANSSFSFKLDYKFNDYTIDISDMSGKTVYSYSGINNGTNDISLNLSNGLYLVKIKANDEYFYQKLQILK